MKITTGHLFWRVSLILLMIMVWQQWNLYELYKQQQQLALMSAIQEETKRMKDDYRQAARYYFLQTLTLPDSLYFADSLIVFDRSSKSRLFERIVYLSRRELLLIMSKRMQEWRPLLEPVLLQSGFHPDFFYMAIAESFLDPLVVSSAQAKGMWQFRWATARRFGLQVNFWVDERLDAISSTKAAVRYLKYLGDKYDNNWSLVAAAYNMGENGLDKYIKRNGHDKYFGMHLPQETSVYFFNILAVKFIVEKTDWLPMFSRASKFVTFDSLARVEVNFSQPVYLKDLIAGFGYDYYLFKLLNGKYRRDILPAGSNIIRVPRGLLDDFILIVKSKGWDYKITP